MIDKKAIVFKGESPSFNQDIDFYKFLQIGVITRVDNERKVIDIQFQSNPIISRTIPLTDPLFTGRAFIGGMPEVGSIVVCGFIKLTNKIGTPVVVAYLDNDYLRSLSYSYDFGRISDEVKKLNSIHEKIGYNVKRLKRRKLYPGDINLESSQGSELLLDNDIVLLDRKLNEIKISSADRKILQNAVSNHIYTNAGRILNGLVERPFSSFVEPTILENGKSLYIVTESAQSPNYNARAFTEMRTEIREMANNVLDIVENYDQNDFSTNTAKGRLLVTQMLGTLVGNVKEDINKYGRVLRPQIFPSDDYNVDVDDIICEPSQYLNLASAYQLAFDSGTKIDIDKEGHTFVHLSASSVKHPLGGGRSLEFASDGSLKLVVGNDNTRHRSVDINTSGMVKMKFGFDPDSLNSLEWELDKAAKIKVNGTDIDGFALKEEYFGNTYEKVHGDKTIDVDGKIRIVVAGKIQEEILGVKTENYINDKMTNYGGDYQEIIVKQRQSKYGEGQVTDIATKGSELNILEGDKKETLVLGNKDVLLTLGDSKEVLTLGDKSTKVVLGNKINEVLTGNIENSITLGNNVTTVTTGDITQSIKLGNSEESIEVGNKNINIKVGDFEVAVTAGNIDIKTTVGTVNMQSATQTVNVQGLLNVNIKSGVKVNVQAPLVDIGPSPVKGGVVTGPPVPSTLCYLTGAPHLGSLTCKASL